MSGLQSGHSDNAKYRDSTWKALVGLHKAKILKSIGVSNYLVRHLVDLIAHTDVVPAVNQVEWHPHHHDPELLKYCRAKGIFLQAYSSLGSSNAVSLRHDRTVIKTAEKLGKSPAQLLLRWAFQQNIGILPKGSSRAHIVENIDLDFELSEDVMSTLSSLKVKEKFAWDPTVVS